MSRRWGNNARFLKTFKDYLVPIFLVLLALVLILIFSFSWRWDGQIVTDTSQFLSITPASSASEVYIEYTWGNKNKIDTETSLYQWEKLQVASESARAIGNGVNFHLNRLGELKYNNEGSYTLYSSELWGETQKDISIEMRYATVSASAGSVFSLSQNEVSSSAYVVSGILEVKNMVGNAVVLQKWERIYIMRGEARDKETDLSLKKEGLNDEQKSSDWFIKNNGNFYLSQSEDTQKDQSQVSSGWSSFSQWSSYITFKNIFDEAEITTSTLVLEWTLNDERIHIVEINGINSEINTQEKTFKLSGIDTSKKVNDIVYRVYDSNSSLLYKWILTLYNTNSSPSGWSSSQSSGLASVEHYPINTSPDYTILTPTQNPYTTTEGVVRIEWRAPAGTVRKVVINDFQLQKFIPNSSSWVYFANSEFGNLMPWVNIYKIQFFWADDTVLYETNFTIIKE